MKEIKIFDNKIRKVWDKEKEEWFFSIVDIIQILSGSQRPRKYWSDLKKRLSEEGSQMSAKIGQLKMKSSDGKEYLTDTGSTKTVLRIIQSIPSKKAEPFKLWLATVGNERINESIDPEISINRAMKNFLKLGKSKEWINQRLKSIEIRKELTNEWEERGIKEGIEYGILTNEILKEWSGMKTKEYKEFKSLKKENLKDNMTNLELVLNMLGEISTTEISKEKEPITFEENKQVAKEGGGVAKKAREELEKRSGSKAVTKEKQEFIEKKVEIIK